MLAQLAFLDWKYFQSCLQYNYHRSKFFNDNTRRIFTSWAKGAFLKSLDLSSFDLISSQNGCFTSQIWYNDFSFRKCIRFPDFYPDFSGFSSNFQISSQNRWITSHIWYNYPFRKFIRFVLSTRIFKSRSRTLKIDGP